MYGYFRIAYTIFKKIALRQAGNKQENYCESVSPVTVAQFSAPGHGQAFI